MAVNTRSIYSYTRLSRQLTCIGGKNIAEQTGA